MTEKELYMNLEKEISKLAKKKQCFKWRSIPD